MLVLLVGNTVIASSLIVVAFMSGLSAGSYLGGKILSHKNPSIFPFALLELLLGIYLVAFPLLFHFLFYKILLYIPYFKSLIAFNSVRLFLCFSFLFFPAFLMGATFPAILLSLPAQYSNKKSAHAGFLYALNTLGGALGAGLAGYILLPHFGFQKTLFFTGLTNMFIFGLGIIIYFATKKDKIFSMSGIPIESVQVGKSWKNIILVFFTMAVFFVGFVSLSYEILMVRIIILLYGNQVHVFTLVLMAFLFGIAISALLGTWVYSKIKNPEYLFVFLLLLSGLGILITPILLLNLPNFNFRWFFGQIGYQFFIFIIILFPVLFLGSILPVVIRLFQTKVHPSTTLNASRLYAINTLGGVCGAGCVNNIFLPVLGTHGVLVLFCLGFILLGLASFLMLEKIFYRKLIFGVSMIISLLLLGRLPTNTIENLFVSVLTDADSQQHHCRLFQEGKATTIVALDSYLDSRHLFLNGVEEVSTRYDHVQLFKMLGMMPVLLHSSNAPKDVLMIAFGAGISADAALQTQKVKALDVIEINPDVKQINSVFQEVNGDVLNHPKFHFIKGDGRNYLLYNQKKYDVIISDATHPFAYDSWTLYTKEFYQSVKSNLKADGVFAQWIPLSLPQEFLRIFFKTLTEEFPHCSFWNISGSDQSFIVATPKSLKIDFRKLKQQIAEIPSTAKLDKYELSHAHQVLNFFALDEKSIFNFIGMEWRINTDNLSYNHRSLYQQKGMLDEGEIAKIVTFMTSIVPYLTNISEKDKALLDQAYIQAKMIHQSFENMFTYDLRVKKTNIYSWDEYIFGTYDNFRKNK